MEKVSWKKGYGFYKADAQKVYDEMKTLDKITPENVLEYARNESSELHKCFEWDDSIAAEKYRLEQAGSVIRLLVVETVNDKKDVPQQRVLQISSEKHVYQPIKFFVENKDEKQILLDRALAELQAFRNRYKMLSELEEVFDAIDALI